MLLPFRHTRRGYQVMSRRRRKGSGEAGSWRDYRILRLAATG